MAKATKVRQTAERSGGRSGRRRRGPSGKGAPAPTSATRPRSAKKAAKASARARAEAARRPLFVHLRTHTAYSLLEGALPIDRLVELTKADGAVALAITDSNNLFGALEFSEKVAAAGIQPIIGSTLALSFASPARADGRGPAASPCGRNGENGTAPGEASDERKQASDGEIALLAKDETGYRNLMALASRAYLDHAETHEPHVTLALLAAHAEGLIALTGGPEGPIDRALSDGQGALAEERLLVLRDIFGDRLYVELQRHGLESERRIEPGLVALAYEHGLPLVATNEPYFPSRDDYEAHDALICIAEGRYISERDRRRLTPEHYFKSQDEMAALFNDLPEAIENTIEVAQRSAFRPVSRAPILPPFVSSGAARKDDAQTALEAKELERQARAGLAARLKRSGPAPGTTEDAYYERLAFELGVIRDMQYPGYFLIVADFIKWAKAQGIPVGPGRGSGAGSVVAWALTITDLDPLRFGLLFERFLNPERVSMPDFDIDFCQERRDEVIRYVQEKYGAERVAQIITFGKLQARMVLRDVGRVLQMPYGQVDRLSKMVPNNPANPISLAEAIADEPRLAEARDEDPRVAKLLDIGQKLEGLYRHASTHAAGVVIGDRPLTELVPLYRDPRSAIPATQFNMKWVEAAGLVKFDFLGLKTLTVIAKTLELIRKSGEGEAPDFARLGLDDPKTYELLSEGRTIGVFQLESAGMREALKQLKPDRFEDIIAMVSLYRPGPMDNIPTYINRKHGREPVSYPHEMLAPILEETYGVIIYQEQVMQIAQVLSGYSLGEADLLRRAMGKKIKAEMAKQRSRFVEGAVANGVDEAQANYIFELVDKFAGYGFNKSHAAAYALLAYQTAYLKANHPVAFLAASMTLDLGNTDKLAVFVDEARAMGLEIRPPCINHSSHDFVPEGDAIRYSLAALKNVGESTAEAIVTERERAGTYRDLGDFARRLAPQAINKRALERLIASGALDCLGAERGALHASTERILAAAHRMASDRASGQNDLFADGPAEVAAAPIELVHTRPWRPAERLAREFEAVGFYLSAHPLDHYRGVLDRLGVETWSAFAERIERGEAHGTLAGVVVSRRERRAKSGHRFAFVVFSDTSGQFEAAVFSDVLADADGLLETGRTVIVRLEAEREHDGEGMRLRVNRVQSLDEAAGRVQERLTVVLNGATALDELAGLLSARGAGEVRLLVRLPDLGREVSLALGERRDISPQRAAALAEVDGVLAVQEN